MGNLKTDLKHDVNVGIVSNIQAAKPEKAEQLVNLIIGVRISQNSEFLIS